MLLSKLEFETSVTKKKKRRRRRAQLAKHKCG
jgi:hypothetical protein